MDGGSKGRADGGRWGKGRGRSDGELREVEGEVLVVRLLPLGLVVGGIHG